jgi:hypothetical protein
VFAFSHVVVHARARRDRGVTMLVRVDICASDAGVLVVSVSHHSSGFAPYRVDNCSPETLHLRYTVVFAPPPPDAPPCLPTRCLQSACDTNRLVQQPSLGRAACAPVPSCAQK